MCTALALAACVGDEGATTPPVTTTLGVSGTSASSETSPTAAVPRATSTSVAGWTLAISQPMPGAKTGRAPTLCYEISGSSRESVVALEVRLLETGSVVSSALVEASIGRGATMAPFGDVPMGTYDLEVGLVVDGELPPGRVVRIPAVTLSDDAPPGGCDGGQSG